MLDKIRGYINDAFADMPNTDKVLDLKQELYANLSDKYDEQLGKGKTPQEAYHAAISSIGDIQQLVESVRDHSALMLGLSPQQRKKSALLTAGAVMLYILSPIAVIVLGSLGEGVMGVVTLLLLVAIATGMLIYNDMTKPKLMKIQEEMMEEREYLMGGTEQEVRAFRAFNGVLWSITTALYLACGLLFGWWATAWLLFVIAAAVKNIVRYYFVLKREERL